MLISVEAMVRRILQARVYEVARETPLDFMTVLSRRLDHPVWLKREDLQQVFSFKLRGAYNKMSQLGPEQRAAGVICASAGNHAQGVALAALRMGCRAVIVMPHTTPEIKIDSVRHRGAEVILHGEQFDEARLHAGMLAQEQGLTLVHPYDDWDVMAGQGTVAAELIRQAPQQLEAVFVPVGGGGLIGGMAPYIKYLRPEVRVIGVEAEDSACLQAALQAGQPVTLSHVGLFADGVAVARIGERPWAMARQCVDEVVTVPVDAMCAAIKDIFDDTRSIAEPSGALALAGLKRWVEMGKASGGALVAIDSGANINFDRLRGISERTEFTERREAILVVTIPERPGSFLAFCEVLGRRNITEFNYRFSNAADQAHVFVGLQLRRGDQEREEIIHALRQNGYEVLDVSGDELATLHVRHLVGGQAHLEDERLYRFEFPERPGALLRFLQQIGSSFNISLFHYRNHGAPYGWVLMGVQLGGRSDSELRQLLDQVGYSYQNESDHVLYQRFLR